MTVTVAHMKVNGADLKAQSALHGLEFQLNVFIPQVKEQAIKDELMTFRSEIWRFQSKLEEVNRLLMKAHLKEP